MSESESKINIGTYFKKGTKFIIPSYQRGYKWGVKQSDDNKSSVEFFCDCLGRAFLRNDKEYFIEAITVVNENGSTILVDGQQRTATLFLLFVALKEFEFLRGIELSYEIREDSHFFLKSLINENHENIQDTDIQDIFYFNIALDTINETIKKIENEIQIKKTNGTWDDSAKTFSEFLKENVFLLLNVIPQEKALNIFIALNGLKAIMKEEELIKSELLIQSSRIKQIDDSLDEKVKYGIEWKINEDRGRLARNWDKWLYWWNKQEVKEYYEIDGHPLYYLLITYWNLEKKNTKGTFSFDQFKNEFLYDSVAAKNHFEGLRKLQKTFEDLYTNYHSYNFLGIILKTSNDKEDALLYYLDKEIKKDISLEEYAKWSLVGATHLEIIQDTKEKTLEEDIEIIVKEKKARGSIALINERYVYRDEDDNELDDRTKCAYRFLLLLNLLEDNKLKRKFDFTIWRNNNRSLEHIYPKSRKSDLNFTKQEFEEGSIHCIGNLVLLYGKNNSEFGAKEVDEKKKIYFNMGSTLEFQSRNLLHSISVFASADWKEKEIIENKRTTIMMLNTYYGIDS